MHNYFDDGESFFNSCDAFTLGPIVEAAYLSSCTFGAFIPDAGYCTAADFSAPVQQDV